MDIKITKHQNDHIFKKKTKTNEQLVQEWQDWKTRRQETIFKGKREFKKLGKFLKRCSEFSLECMTQSTGRNA